MRLPVNPLLARSLRHLAQVAFLVIGLAYAAHELCLFLKKLYQLYKNRR